MFFTVVIFLVVLSVLVLAHELGHFYTARKFGCKVEEFGLGFPPRIKGLGWRSKKTGILYSLNWLPIGGFVKIKGEDGESRNDNDSFGSKPAWKRAIILAAGVSMNMILAAVFLTIGFGLGLPTSLPEDTSELGNVTITDEKIQIYQVAPDLPAAEAGLQLGDELLELDGQIVGATSQVAEYMASHDGQEVSIKLLRGDEEVSITLTPEYYEVSGQSVMGVELVKTGLIKYPWYMLPWKGIEATASLTVAIVVAFYDIIKNLVIGQPAGVEVTGPVGIAALTGQMARMGLVYIMQFMALLSVNLAIINILPIPALDGGRLLFLAIEKIRRKPVDQKIENIIHNIGFLLLIALMIFITYRDVVKWGGGLIEKIFG